MCLDNIEEIAAAVEAAKSAKAEFDAYKDKTIFAGFQKIEVTPQEKFQILKQRLEFAENALKDLGFRGPVAKAAPADPADSQRIVNQR
jgi:hypothetical protein